MPKLKVSGCQQKDRKKVVRKLLSMGFTLLPSDVRDGLLVAPAGVRLGELNDLKRELKKLGRRIFVAGVADSSKTP